jgi:hypothetical protein
LDWPLTVVSQIGWAQGEQPLHVPSHGDRAPPAPHTVDPTQQELPEAHHRFGDAEHRFRYLFAQRIEFPALGRLQPVRYGFDRRGVLRRWRRLCTVLGQSRVMRLAHLLRDANYAVECGDTAFSALFRLLLLRVIAIKRRRATLKDTTLQQYLSDLYRRLDCIMAAFPWASQDASCESA